MYHQVYGQLVKLKLTQENKQVQDSREIENKLKCKTILSLDGNRKKIKDHLTEIAEQVHSEYQFRREANNLSPEEDILRLNNDDTLPDFEVGHFRTTASQESFATQSFEPGDFQHVTWMGAALTAFAFVCDPTENRANSVQILKLLIRFLQEHVRVLTQPSEVVNRLDRVAEVTERIIPDGSLLFLNHRFVRQIEKDLESAMKVN